MRLAPDLRVRVVGRDQLAGLSRGQAQLLGRDPEARDDLPSLVERQRPDPLLDLAEVLLGGLEHRRDVGLGAAGARAPGARCSGERAAGSCGIRAARPPAARWSDSASHAA